MTPPKTSNVLPPVREFFLPKQQAEREYELEEARALHRALVPLETLRGPNVEFAYKIRPVREVGGDFLDFFWLTDGRIGFYIGDVVGKGLPAAMYAALAVGTLRGIHKTGQLPASVLSSMNRRLGVRSIPHRFCAMQYAVLDPRTREVRYSNAGLPRPLHIWAKGCREVGEGGLPVGLFGEARYEQLSVPLQGGEAVLFTTDGIIEAFNSKDEDFGVARMTEVCRRHLSESAEGLLERLFAAVDEFAGGAPQRDDMTAALLKVS